MDSEIIPILLLTALATAITMAAVDINYSQSHLWWMCCDLAALLICYASLKPIVSQKEMKFQKGVENNAS